MYTLLIIFLFVLVLFAIYVFLLFPIILLLQCLFDRRMNAGGKLIVFITSLFLFPIPSYAYGAFIRGGLFSKILIGLTVLCYAIALIGLLVGFLLGGEAQVRQSLQSYGSSLERVLEGHLPDFSKKEPEAVYGGENTYSVEDVQVFESGRGARKRIPVPAQKVPSTSLYEACTGTSSPRMSAEQCRCIADTYETSGSVKSVLLGKGPSHRDKVRTVIIRFFDAIRDKNVAYQKEMREKKNSDLVVGDASKSLGILFLTCKVDTR